MVQAVFRYENGNSMRVACVSVLSPFLLMPGPSNWLNRSSLIRIKKLTLKVVLSSRYPVSESCCSCLQCFIQKIFFSFPYLSQISSPNGRWLKPHSAGLGQHISWVRRTVMALVASLLFTSGIGTSLYMLLTRMLVSGVVQLSSPHFLICIHATKLLLCSLVGHQCLCSGKRHWSRAVSDQWTLLRIGQCKYFLFSIF